MIETPMAGSIALRRAIWAVAILWIGAAIPMPAHGQGEDSMAKDEARTIRLETEVAAPPETVYEAWLDPEAVRGFFAPDCRIEPRVGGAYEMIFDPENDPDGAALGTRGATLLALDPPHRLAFEWKGRPDMPAMNVEPFPTWVEVRFEEMEDRDGWTRVILEHKGFGHGPAWDPVYAWFGEGAWPLVLRRLGERFGREP